jgi:hypothetical protein
MYFDVIDFGFGALREGERVELVRGDGPRVGELISGAVVRRDQAGTLWIHADDHRWRPIPLEFRIIGHRRRDGA